MKNFFNKIINNTEYEDKLLILIYFLFPFLLCISIFLTDFFASVAGLVVIYIFISKINFYNFIKPIKKEIYLFLFFFIIIIISLIFSNNFKASFPSSFFYFRYILFSLGLYYLLKKYKFMIDVLTVSLVSCLILICIDSMLQFFTYQNLFRYNLPNIIGLKIGEDPNITRYVTSFFDQEKKLGSFVVRLLPFIISLTFLYNNLRKYKLDLIIIIFSGIIIFFTTERTALFLYIVFCFFYFLIINYKSLFFIFILSTAIILFQNNDAFFDKYIFGTLNQIGFSERIGTDNYGHSVNSLITKKENRKIYYYSEEHENLSYTGLKIFEKNILTGSGIKNFYSTCFDLIEETKQELKNPDGLHRRNNSLVCSTHPHNTYIQLLSDIGILGFMLISFIFINILLNSLKIVYLGNFKNNPHVSAYYLVNIGIILNLFPFIPSGSFFNNWICYIIFYPIGYWLYLKKKL